MINVVVKANKNRKINFLYMVLAILFFIGIAVFTLTSCRQPNDGFDAQEFYMSNTVQIRSVGAYGIIKTGTGVIISGHPYPIIATNLHVAAKQGSQISVKFFGEDDYVNKETMINENIIEVLAFDELLDLCIFKVDYIPTVLYNDLIKTLSSTDRQPLFRGDALKELVTAKSLGNMNGGGIISLGGEIIALEQIVNTDRGYLPLIATTLPIENGCSGGPLFGEDGRLLGLTSFDSGIFEDGRTFSISAQPLYTLYCRAISNIASGSGGQNQGLDWSIEIEGTGHNISASYIVFQDIGLTLMQKNNEITVFEALAYPQYDGYRLESFGSDDELSSVMAIICQAMRYSQNGTGECLQLRVSQNGESFSMEFDANLWEI